MTAAWLWIIWGAESTEPALARLPPDRRLMAWVGLVLVAVLLLLLVLFIRAAGRFARRYGDRPLQRRRPGFGDDDWARRPLNSSDDEGADD